MKRYINRLVVLMYLAFMAGCSQVPVSPTTAEEPVAMGQSVAAPVAGTTTESAPVETNPIVSNIEPAVVEQYQQALAHMATNKFKPAESLLLQIMTAHSGLAGPYVNLGVIYAQTDRTAEAEHAFAQAIERNPKNLIAHNQLGILYRKSGRFDQALQVYKTALDIDPLYANAHLNLGILYDLYLNQPELALTEYEQYQQLNPVKDEQVALWIDDINNRLRQTVGQTDQGPP